MDIPALSTSLASSELNLKVSVAVAKMAKDSMLQQSSDIAKLINSAAIQPARINGESSLIDICI